MMRRIVGPIGGLKHQLATAMAGTFILNFVSRLLMFGATMLLARLMGPQNYGVYASAIAVVTLVGVPASLGLPNLIVRNVATYRAHEAWELMKGLLLRSNQSAILVTILVAIILYLVQSPLEARFGLDAELLWVTYALLPLTLLGAMRTATLRGLHHIVLGLAPESVVMPGVFIVAVLILGMFVHVQLTSLEVLVARVVAVASAFVIGSIFLIAKLPGKLRHIKPEYRMAQWARSAGPLMWVGAMSVITFQTDVVMLAALRGPADAGIYQVAARAAALVAFVSVISNISLQPTLARLFAQGDLAKLKQVARMAARIMFGSALLVSIIFISASSELLKLFYGSAYANGSMALRILSAGWVLVALTGPARNTLIMTGGEKAAAISISVAATLNVVLNFLFIPRYGVSGAALATATSLIFCQAGYVISIRRRLGYWISVA
jgi:O-antigen/teichoic acid export membrane protein